MTTTTIEWTNRTWNPVRGCARVSPGCENCYAERTAARFCSAGQPYAGLVSVRSKVSGLRYTEPKAAGSWESPRWVGKARFVPEMLGLPLKWRKPRRVFVNSMSDLFHDDVTNEQIAAVFGVMASAPQHTFQVLTKRPERMVEWFKWLQAECVEPAAPTESIVCSIEAVNRGVDVDYLGASARWPLPNVWLGVSCEDQKRADERIPLLLQVPASVRFVSAEPLLGPIDFEHVQWPGRHKVDVLRGGMWAGPGQPAAFPGFTQHSDLATISWVIAGGESGHCARPCDINWIRNIVEQCYNAGTACFVKQLGAKPSLEPTGEFRTTSDGRRQFAVKALRLRDRKGGDMAEWPADLRVRLLPGGAT